MKNSIRWLSSFFLMSLISAPLHSGCRIGNNQETPPSAPPADQTTGYYSTEPKSLVLYMTTTDTQSKEAPVELTPSWVANHFSNPVGLIMTTHSNTGKGVLASIDEIASSRDISGFPIQVNADSSLSFKGKTKPAQLWQDPNCLSWREVTETGTLTRAPRAPLPGTPYPLSGSLQLKIQVLYQFSGQCDSTFQMIAACYQDSSQCGGKTPTENLESQLDVLNTFSPWVESGLINPADLSKIVNFAYEVSYQ
jgi:hypothetical protein